MKGEHFNVKDLKREYERGKRDTMRFIESKQPKDLVCTCLCGDIKWMIDKKELKEFVEGTK
jgi:hypothetical protein